MKKKEGIADRGGFRERIPGYSRIVVKIGTNVLRDAHGNLNVDRIDSFAAEVGELVSGPRRIVIISSGAVAAGAPKIRLKARPRTLPEFQAAAAAGQITLMNEYYAAFKKVGVEVAQVLLTRDDFNDRERYLNIRNCLSYLMDHGVVPIINENDTVAVEELKFGDNDVLAGYVTMGLKADILVILTSAPGLCRGRDGRGKVIPEVSHITPEIEELASGRKTVFGTGGMASKISTAKMVTAAGEPVVIADGREPGILSRVLRGEEVGTLFLPAGDKIPGRKRWIAFSARAAGSVTVDEGAAAAICTRGKSLLAAGVVAVSGTFRSGELIAIKNERGEVIAKGLSNYSSEEIGKIRGRHSREIKKILGYSAYNEVVHRNNMVLGGEE